MDTLMSFEIITWALKQPVKHLSAKFVLMVMANCANSDGICWPSIGYLSDATGQDRKTVIENIKRLVNDAFIIDTGKNGGRTKSVPIYRLISTENGTAADGINGIANGLEAVPFSVEAVPKTDRKQYQKRDTET
jgi:pyocin large subunit-like protein